MNFNPLNPNYLNQLRFNNNTQLKKHKKQTLSSNEKKIAKISPINQQQTNRINKTNNFLAQFDTQINCQKNILHYVRQGYLLAYIKRDHYITGRSFIIFPQGIIASCNVINGKLTGWISVCMKGQFYNLSHFSLGKFHGAQYTYDIRCNLVLQSFYSSGRLQSVKRGVVNSYVSFQKYLKNNQLIDLLHSTLNYQFFTKNYPKINSKLGYYYGSQHKAMPNGIGVLITDYQSFYGNFKRGLLNGEGTMIFANKNCYIGQFESGMMRGYGRVINNGQSQYKCNERDISQTQFNAVISASSYQENKDIQTIFSPIIQFYKKLKNIYQHRKKQVSQKQQSLVEVSVRNSREEQEGEEYDLSEPSNSNPTQNMFYQLLKTNNSKQETNSQKQKKISQPQIKIVRPSQPQKKVKIQQTAPKIQKEKPPQGHKKRDRLIVRDDEWNEIIEQLDDGSISQEDDFLKPKGKSNIADEGQPNKKNTLGSKPTIKNSTHITDQRPEAMQKYQNHMMNKLMNQK